MAYAAVSVKAVFEFPLKTLRIALPKLLRFRILVLPVVPLVGYRDLIGLLLIFVVLWLTLLLHLLLLVLLVLLALLLLDGGTDVVTEAPNFVVDGNSQIRDLLELFEPEIEELGAGRFIGRVVPDGKVLVLKSLLGSDALRWYESEHALQQIQGIWVGIGEGMPEWNPRHVWQTGNVFSCAWLANHLQSVFVGRAQTLENLVELVDVVLALKEWLSAQKFGENTSNRPHIDCKIVR